MRKLKPVEAIVSGNEAWKQHASGSFAPQGMTLVGKFSRKSEKMVGTTMLAEFFSILLE